MFHARPLLRLAKKPYLPYQKVITISPRIVLEPESRFLTAAKTGQPLVVSDSRDVVVLSTRTCCCWSGPDIFTGDLGTDV